MPTIADTSVDAEALLSALPLLVTGGHPYFLKLAAREEVLAHGRSD